MNSTSILERGRPLTFCPSCSRSRSPSRKSGDAAESRRRKWSSFTNIALPQKRAAFGLEGKSSNCKSAVVHPLPKLVSLSTEGSNSVHARSDKLYENMYGVRQCEATTPSKGYSATASLNILDQDTSHTSNDYAHSLSDDAASSFGESSPLTPYTFSSVTTSYFDDIPDSNKIRKRNITDSIESLEDVPAHKLSDTMMENGALTSLPRTLYQSRSQFTSLKRIRTGRLSSIQRGSALVFSAILMTILIQVTVAMLGTDISISSSST